MRVWGVYLFLMQIRKVEIVIMNNEYDMWELMALAKAITTFCFSNDKSNDSNDDATFYEIDKVQKVML